MAVPVEDGFVLASCVKRFRGFGGKQEILIHELFHIAPWPRKAGKTTGGQSCGIFLSAYKTKIPLIGKDVKICAQNSTKHT